MSGDMNTALGNCLLMTGMVFGAMNHLGVRQFQVVDDGDDCLVLVERSELERLQRELPRVFLEFGQELKLENIARHPQEIVFCQCKLTWASDGWTMARDWRKVLSQSCCGTKHWNNPRVVPGMFGALGDCENALHGGIPILGAFAKRLRELSGGSRVSMEHLDTSYQYRVGQYQLGQVRDIPDKIVTWEARFQFELTWGVDVATQLAIEHQIALWTPGIQFRDVGPELDYRWEHTLDPGIPQPTVL